MHPQACILLGEPFDVRRVGRTDDLRGADVDAEPGGAGADLALIPEDRQVGDVTRDQARRRAQDAVVVALGQHDALAVGSCSFDESVLEHQRCHDPRFREPELRREFCDVDVGLEQTECAFVAVTGIRCQAPARPHHAHRGVVGAVLGRDDRDGGREPVEKPLDRLGQGERTVQDDPRDRRECSCRIRHQRGEQHLGAIRGDHHDGILREARQHVHHRHARYHDAQRFTGEQIGVALYEPPVDGCEDAADRRRHERAILRDRPDRSALRLR